MACLAAHLSENAHALTGKDATRWNRIQSVLDSDQSLEAALLKVPPTDTLEEWIAKETCELLIPAERKVIAKVIRGEHLLRLSSLLTKLLTRGELLPILTSNYDRLVEVACEMAGFHVDTTAIGHYAGGFNHDQSCMGSCKGIKTRGKTTYLDHFPRAIVLKPHGSFDWYQCGGYPRRSSMDLDAERLMITPGLNKYRAGYASPFDKHRELANEYIKGARCFLIVGYGFNDDHLQTHLERRIREGVPTLILNRSTNAHMDDLINGSPHCICLSSREEGRGFTMSRKDDYMKNSDQDLWDLGVLVREALT